MFIRMLWSLVWTVSVRWLPRSMGSGWKRFLLRSFGAKIAPTAVVYSSAKVYFPSNLTMDDYACLATDVDCYNVAPIHVGRFATVSQGAFYVQLHMTFRLPVMSLLPSQLKSRNVHGLPPEHSWEWV